MGRLFNIMIKAGLFVVFIQFLTPSVLAESATDDLKKTIDLILETLRDESIPMEEKKSKIEVQVRERFDYHLMSKRTLGKSWKMATEEEREKFVSLYSDMLSKTYLKNLENFSNEVVEYKNEKLKKKVYAIVDTAIISKNKSIPIVYRLKKGNEWKVYDVVIEGVSLIKNFKSTYDSVIDKQGIDGLLVKMAEKLKDMDKPEESKG